VLLFSVHECQASSWSSSPGFWLFLFLFRQARPLGSVYPHATCNWRALIKGKTRKIMKWLCILYKGRGRGPRRFLSDSQALLIAQTQILSTNKPILIQTPRSSFSDCYCYRQTDCCHASFSSVWLRLWTNKGLLLCCH